MHDICLAGGDDFVSTLCRIAFDVVSAGVRMVEGNLSSAHAWQCFVHWLIGWLRLAVS